MIPYECTTIAQHYLSYNTGHCPSWAPYSPSATLRKQARTCCKARVPAGGLDHGMPRINELGLPQGFALVALLVLLSVRHFVATAVFTNYPRIFWGV